LTTPSKVFDEKLKLFWTKSEIDKKIVFSEEKYFSSRCSRGHVEHSFENPAEVFFARRLKIFGSMPVRDLKKLSERIFFLKKFQWIR